MPDLKLESTAIGAFDKKITHLEGHHKASPGAAPQQVWPLDWIDDLPAALRNYRAVLWDKISGSVVVLPQGSFNETIPRVALKPNTHTKFGAAMSVISLGSGRLSNFRDGNQFELLVGKLTD